MDGRAKHIRNVAILVGLALIVWLLPGGNTAAGVIGNVLSVLFLSAICFFGYRMYMEHRVALFDLEGRLRTILYASAGMFVLALIATGRMWNEGPALILLWMGMIGASAYGGYVVFRSTREY